MPLPQPDPDALEHSRALSRRIAADIAQAGGWIGFDDWMRRALYEPGMGYYSGPLRKFGAEGDFVTAPEMSPLFAACVARQVSQWFAHTRAEVVEFGAGTGRLAGELLAELARLGTPVRRYAIVELSGTLRERQRDTIARLAPAALGSVQWLDTMPETIDGVVLANELLDAMPVRVFGREAGATSEWGVALDDAGAFRWAARPADRVLHEEAAQALALGGVAHDARYRSEVGLEGRAWVETVGRALHRGALLLIDYGFPAHEYYHPQRDTGTLIAHFRHHSHGDALHLPGLQDVTAHVDFGAVARAAARAGLAPLGYTSQARFLINCGLLDMLTDAAHAAPRGPETVEQARRLGAVQTLLSEAEMGELFKAIAFGRGLPDDALGFARGDRSAAL
jgi:SAM-dependent MidA family methyltransferase